MSSMKRYVFCQISNKRINPRGKLPSVEEQYYDTLWEKKAGDGYRKSEHFWEIPKWIADISGPLREHTDAEQVLHIIDKDLSLPVWDDKVPTYYLFSVMDANIDIIREIIDQNQFANFMLGGYVDFCHISDIETEYAGKAPTRRPLIRWYTTIEGFLHDITGVACGVNPSYELFEGTSCIPRLTMSTGCSNKCKFCSVPNIVTPMTFTECMTQCLSFDDLDFKLVYLDDKTFGQCANREWLNGLGNTFRNDNPNFKGFIVQTTCRMVLRHPEFFQSDDIFAVELGVETFNNKILRDLLKPQNERMIDEAVEALRVKEINVIPNIMLGLPGETLETYGKTLHWLFVNRWKLYALNIYTVALHPGSKLTEEAGTITPEDQGENQGDRTFWTDENREAYNLLHDEFFKIGMKVL